MRARVVPGARGKGKLKALPRVRAGVRVRAMARASKIRCVQIR